MKGKLRNLLLKLVNLLQKGLVLEYARLDNKNMALLSEHLNLTSGDQKGQVRYLLNNVFNYEEFDLKRNGFSVGLACADGV